MYNINCSILYCILYDILYTFGKVLANISRSKQRMRVPICVRYNIK